MYGLTPCPLCSGYDQHRRECYLRGKEDIRPDGVNVDWAATLALHGVEPSQFKVNVDAMTTYLVWKVTREEDLHIIPRRYIDVAITMDAPPEEQSPNLIDRHRAYSARFGDAA